MGTKPTYCSSCVLATLTTLAPENPSGINFRTLPVASHKTFPQFSLCPRTSSTYLAVLPLSPISPLLSYHSAKKYTNHEHCRCRSVVEIGSSYISYMLYKCGKQLLSDRINTINNATVTIL